MSNQKLETDITRNNEASSVFGKEKYQDSSKDIEKALNLKADEVRYREMIRLFNEKRHKRIYQEGLVMTDNHARSFIYFKDLINIEDTKLQKWIKDFEETYPHFKNSIYIRKFEGKIFFSVEPLLLSGAEKETAKELTDQIKKLIKTNDQK